ncbi:MAG: imidazole glycerol phosphate synthase subunit HisF [Alphaproteobacteria bacterium]|nr:imidazole glycerol phosphate synthase subunit HisF [Alphaproteobacteria bacterium]
MLRHRIIPTLLLHDMGLFKTVKFNVKKGKYVGDPINAIKIFNDKGVDELVFLDIDASKEKRGPNLDAIRDFAEECFMPVAYGGGLRNLDDIKDVLTIGIEKVVLNTILFTDIDLLTRASEVYGSSSIVASVDVKKNFRGQYRVYNSATKKLLSIDLLDYIRDIEKRGAGEIFLSSVDRDGTFEGYDVELINMISRELKIPLIANGGAKDIADFSKVIKFGGASAVSAGSMFVFNGTHKAVLITYPEYSELEKEIGKL